VTSDPVPYLSLPDDFSERVMFPSDRRADFPRGVTSSGLRLQP